MRDHRLNAKCWFNWKKSNIINHKNLLSHIEMDKGVLTFADIVIEKDTFCCCKSPTFLEELDIKNILVSSKIFSSEKNYRYFIG